jgi:hypothetical protein
MRALERLVYWIASVRRFWGRRSQDPLPMATDEKTAERVKHADSDNVTGQDNIYPLW